jgi:hypothetical protein
LARRPDGFTGGIRPGARRVTEHGADDLGERRRTGGLPDPGQGGDHHPQRGNVVRDPAGRDLAAVVAK